LRKNPSILEVYKGTKNGLKSKKIYQLHKGVNRKNAKPRHPLIQSLKKTTISAPEWSSHNPQSGEHFALAKDTTTHNEEQTAKPNNTYVALY
jgi:hypothetical protein